MPLKHRTETALLLVLACAICVAGIALGLLPSLTTASAPLWFVAFAVSVLYPASLRGLLRRNRADYEFRALHWFPAGMIALWAVLQLLARFFEPLRVLFDGFFVLWTLPLVAVGVLLLGIFSFHVLRRRRLRITLLSLLLAFFTAGSGMATLAGFQPTALRDPAAPLTDVSPRTMAQAALGRVRRFFAARVPDASPSDRDVPAGTALSSSVPSSLSTLDFLQARPAFPPIIAERPPHALAGSGPIESAGVLAALLLALHSATLHRRARRLLRR